MAEFTKGKWIIDEVNGEILADGVLIANIAKYGALFSPVSEEVEANARLLVNAPEIYELLRECVTFLTLTTTGISLLEDRCFEVIKRINVRR